MTAPSTGIIVRDYAITTAVGSGLVLASQEAIRLATKNPHIGRNECIAALGGAVLGTVLKVGVNYYLRKDTIPFAELSYIRRLRDRQDVIFPLFTAAAVSVLYSYLKKS